MKKLLLLFILIAATRTLHAQTLEESTFENVIDTVIVHAAKTNCSGISFYITPYMRERKKTADPADTLASQWIERPDGFQGVEPDSIHCTFINDSFVLVKVGRYFKYYTVRNGALVSFPPKTVKETYHDSAGYLVHETTVMSQGVIARYTRLVSDSFNRICQAVYYNYGKLELIRYYEYYGDSAYFMKSFAPSPDSLHMYKAINDSIINYYKPAPYPDSLMPSEEVYVSYTFDNNGHVIKETSLITVYEPGSGKKRPADTYIIQYIYSFDAMHRLTGITRMTELVKYEMKISYAMKPAKKH